jgi:hypothetical protein
MNSAEFKALFLKDVPPPEKKCRWIVLGQNQSSKLMNFRVNNLEFSN